MHVARAHMVVRMVPSKTRGSARSAAAEQNLQNPQGGVSFWQPINTCPRRMQRGNRPAPKRPRPGVRLSDRVLLKRLAPNDLLVLVLSPFSDLGDLDWRRSQKNKDLAASHRRGCHGGGGRATSA